jgi:hypothetical protein
MTLLGHRAGSGFRFFDHAAIGGDDAYLAARCGDHAYGAAVDLLADDGLDFGEMAFACRFPQ